LILFLVVLTLFSLLVITYFPLFQIDSHSYLEDRFIYARAILDKGLKNNDSTQIAEGYYLLGKREMDKANFAESYKMFYHALKINDARKDNFNAGKVYLRLSNLERKSGNIKKAVAYIRDAISSFKKLPDNPKVPTQGAKEKEQRLASAYKEMGNIYFDHNYLQNNTNLDSALYYFLKAESHFIKYNKNSELYYLRQKIGEVYILKKDKRSIDYLENALLDMEKVDSVVFRLHIAKAKAWRTLGNSSKAKEMIEEAETLVEKGFSLPIDALIEYHNVYASYYIDQGDLKNAMNHKDKVIAYFGIMSSADREGNMSLWRTQLQTHKKDLELNLQQEKISSKQKLISQQQLFIGILGLFFILLLSLMYYLNKSLKKQKILTLKNEILIQEQSHRVKNNLQVISSLLSLQADYLKDNILYNAFIESQTRINSMLILHRKLYENDNVELINITDFLLDIGTSVAHTFGVNNLTIREKINQQYLNTDLALSLGLIFNELIINSFKYVFVKEEPLIEIRLKEAENNTLTLSYKDFGKKDLSKIVNKKNKETFGLSLIEMILFQIDGSLNYKYEGGSCFIITFKNI
jgi:two-component sensor histidine kinase